MPDERTHRGPHPQDARFFAPEALPPLELAVHDLSWLLTRGYSRDAALVLVGDRFKLTARQRLALGRCACSDQARARRARHRVEDVGGKVVWVDGFNLVLTLEAALGGGLLMRARDGCIRDLASMHGSYRRVAETEGAVSLLADGLAELRPAAVRCLLDRPVSNSGRLAERLRETGWDVELVPNPDPLLAACPDPIVSSDSAILDRCATWLNLTALLLPRIAGAWVVDLEGRPHG